MKLYYPLEDLWSSGLEDKLVWHFTVKYMGKNEHEVGKLLTRAEITGDSRIQDHQIYQLHSYKWDLELNQTEELWVHAQQYREAMELK